MLSIGVVLGGGGVVGSAYHVGTLAALAEATGWDAAHHADLLVGTSAGASIAATLRAGISAQDHFASSQGRPIAEARYIRREDLVYETPPPPGLVERYRPLSPLMLPALARIGVPRLGMLAGLLPAGRTDGRPLGDRVRAVMPERWPAAPLWMCVTRVSDGARVVLGRDDVDVADAGVAAEASSAVPGRIRPVVIDGRAYVDGGVYSATNADLVAPLGFDLVVVVSPMSAAGPLGWSADYVVRRLCGLQLAGEVDAIRRRGTPVLVIEPATDDLTAMGTDLFDGTRAMTVADAARRSTRRRVDDPAVARPLALLRAAAAERSAVPACG